MPGMFILIFPNMKTEKKNATSEWTHDISLVGLISFSSYSSSWMQSLTVGDSSSTP